MRSVSSADVVDYYLMFFSSDFYFFHRSVHPQLSVVRMNRDDAHRRMRQMAFAVKFIDTDKMMLTHNLLKYSSESMVSRDDLCFSLFDVSDSTVNILFA